MARFKYKLKRRLNNTPENNLPNADWTVSKIRDYLDSNNIEYKVKDTKAALLKLVV